MSGQPARGYLGISEVLAELRADFPDISVSKIRFLETEGLIAPERSPAGYRRFHGPDVDRLRFILAAQRDQYLPLRVIRERLAKLDEEPDGGVPGSRPEAPQWRVDTPGSKSRRTGAAGARAGVADHQDSAANADQRPQLTRRELVESAGLSDALLTELETFGLLQKTGRHYGPEALAVARTAAALTAFGVEARHLRAVRAAAERETTMIESLVAPILRQRNPGARDLAGRTARDCAYLVLRLHAALVEAALAEAGLAVPARPLSAPDAEQAESDTPDGRHPAGTRQRHTRGIEGATA
jgi:DNA-binding transcriptional MerR regulator